MINTDRYKGKTVTIVGLARSGMCSARLAFLSGAQVRVTDIKSDQGTSQRMALLKEEIPHISFELGVHSPDFIKGSDLLVISPGVPEDALPIKWALAQGIPAISEIEFSYSLCPAPIIAVTGSNGKTTVTTLIGKVLLSSGRKVFVCGNIGNPFSGEVPAITANDLVCLEVSSFQLETISKFKPKAAVILNFSPNHLDRHPSMDDYLRAKKRIFLNQDENDYLVLNGQDAVLSAIGREARSGKVFFKADGELDPNQAAVVAVAGLFGVTRAKCLEGFREFKGIEHRMEYVGEYKGVKFINDSKATTVESTIWALNSLSGPVILIAGGKDKGVDYQAVREPAALKVKKIYLIGQARNKIREALRGFDPIEEANSLQEAVSEAFRFAHPGDCILLSPMCASFDMFRDYEQRGKVFKESVAALAGDKR